MLVIFDLDGTLSDATHRTHFLYCRPKKWREFYLACGGDAPIRHTIHLLHLLYNEGHNIEIWSGRSDLVFEQTVDWLASYGILSWYTRDMKLRREGDHRSDVELKKIWLDECSPHDRPDLVFEDRSRVVKMWRENDIPCFQVADGNF